MTNIILVAKKEQEEFEKVKKVKRIQTLFLVVSLLLLTLISFGCSEEGNEYGIKPAGNESSINGTWSGKYGSSVKFNIKFSDGKILEFNDTGLGIRMTTNSGYIGMYSLDKQGNFTARLNSRAPGALVGFVTDELSGKISGSAGSGQWIYLKEGKPVKTFTFTIGSRN